MNEVYPKEFLENISYLYHTEEYAITFHKALSSENDYSIKCYDQSNNIKVYNDEIFNLNISK